MKFVFIQNYLRQTKPFQLIKSRHRLSQLTNSIMLTISCYPILHVQTMISKVNILSATFRADGSSKFSKDNRWGFFLPQLLHGVCHLKTSWKVLNHG